MIARVLPSLSLNHTPLWPPIEAISPSQMTPSISKVSKVTPRPFRVLDDLPHVVHGPLHDRVLGRAGERRREQGGLAARTVVPDPAHVLGRGLKAELLPLSGLATFDIRDRDGRVWLELIEHPRPLCGHSVALFRQHRAPALDVYTPRSLLRRRRVAARASASRNLLGGQARGDSNGALHEPVAMRYTTNTTPLAVRNQPNARLICGPSTTWANLPATAAIGTAPSANAAATAQSICPNDQCTSNVGVAKTMTTNKLVPAAWRIRSPNSSMYAGDQQEPAPVREQARREPDDGRDADEHPAMLAALSTSDSHRRVDAPDHAGADGDQRHAGQDQQRGAANERGGIHPKDRSGQAADHGPCRRAETSLLSAHRG